MERTHKDTGSHHLSKTALPHYTIVRIETDSRRQAPSVVVIFMCGGDARNFEPKTRLKFEDLDKSIQKLRAIYKVHPEWFEVPKPKSNKGQNAVDYSV